ncbi:MAG TPA: hypothetical protein HA356_03930 [Candidatus Poseidoniaceae archaeon]|nr:MAG TPA: hypothetical protein D7H95_03920 [Candidatus Poseidoniales archaeon]HII11206.1 hypothetical protein [Candidatus Poseidoniaceae archaeon]|tara:strand:- start:2368 stop:2964 length:597 start_codon:yes stop_codon:yes gene_type:complete
MRYDLLALVCISLSLCTGCIEPQSIDDGELTAPPLHMTFEAQTLDRTEDGGATFDLKETLNDGPVLMLWIGAGCSGCHDWTQLIRTSMDEGQFNGSNISVVSVHRWAQFETTQDVSDTFSVASNKTHYTPWTVVVPQLDTPTFDFNSGQKTAYPLYEAYGNPGTPTLQLIDQDGALAWQSKTYWANETVLEEALSFFE